MSTRHIAAETARLHDLTPKGDSGGASKRFRQKLASDGFTVDEGFRLKPGYLYTVVRAISARVNQNYDGWPSDELKKSYKTFIGKPCFVNHENHDPTKARGVVVASRYVENGMDKYIEVVQEIDANRFPKLAHEIKSGGLDSVSMGAEAGFTICSYCHNKATDLDDMCDHVINHKGKTLSRLDRKTGKREDVLIFESCHKISFFELSYVFEPADETAVASKVVVAGKQHRESGLDWKQYQDSFTDSVGIKPDSEFLEATHPSGHHYWVNTEHGKPHSWEVEHHPPGVTPGMQIGDVYPGFPTREDAMSWADKRHEGDSYDPESDPFDPRQFGASRRTADTLPEQSGAASGTSAATPSTGGSNDGSAAGGLLQTMKNDNAQGIAESAAGKPYGFGGSGEGSTNAKGQSTDLFDCTGLTGDLMSATTGKQDPSAPMTTDGKGGRFNTTSDMAAQGLVPGASPGDFNIGLNPAPGAAGHAAVQLPGGQKAESSSRDGTEFGPGARAITDKPFTQQWHMPGTSYPAGVNPLGDPRNATPSVEQLLLPKTSSRQDNADLAEIMAMTRTASEDLTVPAPPGAQTIDQSVIDATPVVELSPATELTGHEAPGLGKSSGKYTKDDFNHPSGKMPWERDTESDTEDAAAIEIEAMMRFSETPTDEYEAWKSEHGERAERERHAPLSAPISLVQQKWLHEQDVLQKRMMARRRALAMVRTSGPTDDGLEVIPENSRRTQRPGTEKTYNKVHDFFDQIGAPNEGGSEGVLDYGAGLGHGGRWGHTYEPHPSDNLAPGAGNHPTWQEADEVPSGKFNRVTNIHVLNVVPPEVRHQIVDGIKDAMAPGGHAVIVTRSKSDVDSTKNKIPVDNGDPGAYHVVDPKNPDDRTYQKGFTPDELHQYVSDRMGPSYAVSKIPGKHRLSAPAVHVIKHPEADTASNERIGAVKRLARQRALHLAFGEIEAPMAVDTLREEGTAPEDDDDDFERYVDPPKDLQTPDLSQAQQVDREQEEDGATPDQMGEVPGAADPSAMGQPQQQFMTLQIPLPEGAPQVPQQAAPPVMAQPPMPPEDPTQDPAAGQPQQIAASLLDYFDGYYGRRVANWMDAIEARREMTPAEAADYRRQAVKLSTLENGREHSTTTRNPTKGTATMARNSIASRSKVARAGRRQHLADGPLVDGGPYGRNDEGEQEEAFISQVPPAVSGDYVTEGTDISNTEHNLVARVQQGRAQLLRDAQQLASLQQRRAFDESGGPTAEVVDPRVRDSASEELTGDNFVSANPNDGVVPTNPKDASLRAFQAFDGWLAQKTGKSSRRHTESNIKKAAAAFSREAGISPQMLFPALGIVLREARKNDKKASKGANMRKRANESLEVAAPDGRVDVEAPVENVTSAEAQASQFDLHDFGNNAGDNVANPDLSTDQNWAPGEASKTSARVKTAGGLLAMRCAEGMIAAGLEPNERERKYQLAAEFENMNRGLIQDRVALLEKFAAVRQSDLRRVASGSSRGAARSPIPAGLGGGTRTAAAGFKTAANDPSNDSSLFI